MIRALCVLAFAALPALTVAAAAAVGPVTHLPLPRYVSLKSGEVNMRRGPGNDHPIKWVYKRRNMPVEVTNEYEDWLQVRDIDGEQGWINRQLLSGEPRYVVVKAREGKGSAPSRDPASGWKLHRQAKIDSKAVAYVLPGVIAEVRNCPEAWCEVRAGNVTGWIERTALWGIYPDEKLR